MPKSKARPAWATGLILLLMAAGVSAAVNPRRLFARDGICGSDAKLAQCSQSGLPEDFCCGKADTCIVLAGKTTVLCCPQGSTCNTIAPIPCDLKLQDASQNPAAAIKTTVLNGKLEICHGGCCPFGYRCEGNGSCRLNEDQSERPPAAGPAPTSTGAGEPTATATTKTSVPSTTLQISASASAGFGASPTGDAVVTPEPSADETSPESGGTPIGAIIGGVVAALLAVAAVIWLVVFLRRRKTRKRDLVRNDSSSSFGNIVVSAPQPIQGYPNMRQDFLAKTSSNNSMVSSTLASPQARSMASDRASTKLSQPYSHRASDEMSPQQDDGRSYHHSAEIRALRSLTSDPFVSPPRTPENKGRKGNGGPANIDIYVEEPSSVGSSRSKTTTTTVRSGRNGTGDNGLLGPTLQVPRQRDTTWSNILHGAGGIPETPTKPRR